MRRAAALLPVLLLAACGPVEATGTLTVMTYNVAGLPQGISGSNPEANTWQIGQRLNDWELVVVQEDFWYHADLVGETTHPHQSDPMVAEPTLTEMGDGLNRFSQTAFTGHERHTWAVCNGTTSDGSDCGTTKGFSVARHTLAEGVEVDLYNLHMDASGSLADQQARSDQVDQLLTYIDTYSGTRPVIVAGDTNLRPERADRAMDATSLDRLLADAGLVDGCRFVSCPIEEIDRIMVRPTSPTGVDGSRYATLQLTPTEWTLHEEFDDENGDPLSDHEPVTVTLEWTAGNFD